MITHPNYDANDPWALRERGLDLGTLAQSESVFALANGHIGLRGNLDEGEPVGLPGTYLNGFHETRPLPYAESAYGNPEAGETVVNVTDAKLMRLHVDDELFDVRYGELLSHERVLDFRAGMLRREVHWRSPAGAEVRIRSKRLVSFSQRGVAAIEYEVEPVGRSARLVIQSELVTNEDGHTGAPSGPGGAEHGGDPRGAAALAQPLEGLESFADDMRVSLVHRTKRSGALVCVSADHEVEGPAGTETTVEHGDDAARVIVAADVPEGSTLRVLKFISYAWSGHRALPSVRAQARGGLAEAAHTGWDGLCEEQRAYLDAFWEGADVEVDGDGELQQAIRFSLFHVLQAGARAERRAIAAKGLTGSGYDGHAFWDSESFVLPVLTYTSPDAAADALRWRFETLGLARDRAQQLGWAGAAFPWRTITGQECSGYWPAGSAAVHIGADIADAVLRYQRASGDPVFAREVGLPLLVETARLWISLGHYDRKNRFRLAGVTGPDEYSALSDDNTYTNLMARRNLLGAAEAVDAHPESAAGLGVGHDESTQWRRAADAMHVPYDGILDVHMQAEGFTHHAVWDFEATPAENYPLLLHYPYFDLYRKQVVKQADLVLALYTCGDRFTAEQKARAFAYYEPLTVRDSSLSACVQAIVAAETGHLELAYDYLGEAAYMDLHDLEHNTRDGLHIASLAGSWLALVAGFGGFRDHDGVLSFAPRVPPGVDRLAFRIGVSTGRVLVEVDAENAHYTLQSGEALEIHHHAELVHLTADSGRVSRPIPPLPHRERPRQPSGREPLRRSAPRA
ncbi:glycoside hydrolase family 65 protein [Conexibacter woesei]|uniref:glycoside hydrolase family 65 protein n=1 Tax=Conexibacter woesei TaxID=191495 RepID=UPI0004112681|nr:glycosyl hydrolase family 65 protein [Conexibacter woesei]